MGVWAGRGMFPRIFLKVRAIGIFRVIFRRGL
jgi:hypothetical protein